MAGTCTVCGRPGKKLPGGAHASCGGLALRAPGPRQKIRPSGMKRWSKVRASTLKGKYARNSVASRVSEADKVRGLGTKETALWTATPKSRRKLIGGKPHVQMYRPEFGTTVFLPISYLPASHLKDALRATVRGKYPRY